MASRWRHNSSLKACASVLRLGWTHAGVISARLRICQHNRRCCTAFVAARGVLALSAWGNWRAKLRSIAPQAIPQRLQYL